MEKDLIIFTDCGDTLVDESTQIFDDNGDVLKADFFDGAEETLKALNEEGYRIILVADGRIASFHNIFRELGMEYIFEQWVISEEFGQEKPASIMFETAMQRAGLTDADKHRIVMIGNNIQRDIVGANRMGICSILQSQSPRYDMTASTVEETPDYVVSKPSELLTLLEQLDLQIKNKKVLNRA